MFVSHFRLLGSAGDARVRGPLVVWGTSTWLIKSCMNLVLNFSVFLGFLYWLSWRQRFLISGNFEFLIKFWIEIVVSQFLTSLKLLALQLLLFIFGMRLIVALQLLKRSATHSKERGWTGSTSSYCVGALVTDADISMIICSRSAVEEAERVRARSGREYCAAAARTRTHV